MDCEAIKEQFPCREDLIESLNDFIGDACEIFPAAIFVSGLSGTGKTSILKAFLRQHKLDETPVLGAYVDCVECYSSKVLFENILWNFESNFDADIHCDTMKDFIEALANNNTATDFDSRSYVIVLDSAERMRNMDLNVMPSFMRLQELSGLNICVIFLSQLSLEKFYCKTGMPDVILMESPQYTKTETLRILSCDLDANKEILSEKIEQKHSARENAESIIKAQLDIVNAVSSEFFINYLNAFLSVFYKACRDIPELKITSRKCFAVYMKPVLDGSIDQSDVARLWRNVSSYLRSALSQIYMRLDDSDDENLDEASSSSARPQNVLKMAQTLDLPYYAKYLLIAAFLASHNSPKDDKRLFVKNHGKQRKRLQTVNQKAKTVDKMSTSLGPKSFTIDRLLAIFYAILEEKVGLTCNLLSQISTLVQLKFICFVSGESNIMEGSARLQCTVGLEFIINIGKGVGFNVRQYLSDFM